jgi:hypothetical protein
MMWMEACLLLGCVFHLIVIWSCIVSPVVGWKNFHVSGYHTGNY